MPVMASGARATVVKGTVRGRTVGLKMFSADPGEMATGYRSLHEHRMSSPCRALVEAQWEERAIYLDGRSYPGVIMDWQEGSLLDGFLDHFVGQSSAVLSLAQSWENLARELSAAQIAHGDLQHGNIIVTADQRVQLIDLDSVWVPGLHRAAPEVGLPAYQHPKRSKSDWGPDVDAFSVLLVAASLRALAVRPNLWRLNDQTNLIFSKESLADPHHEIWGDLIDTGGAVAEYVTCLQRWSQRRAGWLTLSNVIDLFEPGTPSSEGFDFWAGGPSSLYMPERPGMHEGGPNGRSRR